MQNHIEKNVDPDEKASKILENLKNSSKGKVGPGCDPDVLNALE